MSRSRGTSTSIAALLLGATAAGVTVGSAGATDVAPGSLPDVIRVGVPLDTSGDLSTVVQIGLAEREGVRVAADEINETGFLGDTTIELVEVDTKTDKDEAVRAVLGFLDEEIDAIVGFTITPSLLAAGPEADAEGVPVIAVGIGTPGVEDIGDFVFRVNPDLGTIYPALDTAFLEAVGAETVGMVYAGDSDSGVGTHEARKAAISEAGYDIVSEQAVGIADTEFRTALTELASASPDAIVVSLSPQQIATLAIQAEELGLESTLISVAGADTEAAIASAGDAFECMLVPSLWFAGNETVANQNFVERFDDFSDLSVDTYAAEGYDALWIYASAVKAAGSSDGDAVRDALAELTHEGALGTYDYAADEGSGAPGLVGMPVIVMDGESVAWTPETECGG